MQWNGYQIADEIKYPPEIVVLCGSTRFVAMFREVNLRLTLQGKIVLSIGCDLRSDEQVFAGMPEEALTQTKLMLDALHRRKIEAANTVYVLNVGDYIGASTGSEIRWARVLHKPIQWLEKHTCHDRCPCHYDSVLAYDSTPKEQQHV